MNSEYKNLAVWQKADELAKEVYSITQSFSGETAYSIITQLRRAASSIPAHIGEGAARDGAATPKQFLTIAFGSLAETEYLLEFCYRLKYIEVENYSRLERLRKEVGGLLWTLYHSVN